MTGNNNKKYSIEILNDSNSIISEKTDGVWNLIDTLNHIFFITDTNELLVPSFHIVDFNNDGNQDLLCWVGTNMNGNQWSEIYLNNATTLIKLKNTADGIWASPEYYIEDSTITCEEVAGNFGVFYKSKYKLIGFIAIPIEKHEIDNTEMFYKKGKYIGQITRDYVGKNGEWEIVNSKNVK